MLNYKLRSLFIIVALILLNAGAGWAVDVEKRLPEPITIEFRDLDIYSALKNISDMTKIPILPSAYVNGRITARFKTMPLQNVLKAVCDSTGSTFAIIDDAIYIIKPAKKEEKPIIAVNEQEAETAKEEKRIMCSEKLVRLKYLKASDILVSIPSGIPVANLKIMDEQNAVYVSGGGEIVRKFEEYVSSIDTSPPQVMLEMLVVEVTHTSGEDYQFNFGGTQNNVTASVLPSYSQVTVNSVDWLPAQFSAMLKASISSGKVRLKANPRVVTVSGKEAVIKTGMGGYYKDGATYPWQIKMFDYGIILRVRPCVTSSGEIILELHPEVNTVTGKTADNLPEMNRRTVDTTVRVRDGQTVTIGGLMQEDENFIYKKVPFLGDIPILGYLFTAKTVTAVQKEVVIYVTPTILAETR